MCGVLVLNVQFADLRADEASIVLLQSPSPSEEIRAKQKIGCV